MTSGVQLRQGITAGAVWGQELEAIAARAEALEIRHDPPTLPELVELANEAHRYLFLALSPAVIARSCRLSARLHVPVLSVPPLDEQVDSVHQTRSRVHDQTADVPPPAETAAPAPCPPGLELEQEEPEDQPAAPGPPAAPRRERRQLRPASQRMKRRDPEPPADPPAVEVEPMPVAVEAEPVALAPAVEVEPEALPEPAPSPPPAGWLVTDEVAQLLDATGVTVGRWRSAGRFGAKGEGWVKYGGSYHYSPDAVEAVMAGDDPPGLDQLVSDVRP
jgi:hypothetical protein